MRDAGKLPAHAELVRDCMCGQWTEGSFEGTTWAFGDLELWILSELERCSPWPLASLTSRLLRRLAVWMSHADSSAYQTWAGRTSRTSGTSTGGVQGALIRMHRPQARPRWTPRREDSSPSLNRVSRWDKNLKEAWQTCPCVERMTEIADTRASWWVGRAGACASFLGNGMASTSRAYHFCQCLPPYLYCQASAEAGLRAQDTAWSNVHVNGVSCQYAPPQSVGHSGYRVV